MFLVMFSLLFTTFPMRSQKQKRENIMAQEYRTSEPSQEQESSTFSREEVVYRRYAPQIFAYLLRNVPSRQDAEDLLLEVFQVVLEKVPPVDEPHLALYLRAVARNKMVDYYRRRGKHQLVSLEDVEERVYEREELDPERILLTREQHEMLHQAISALPELQQTILRLRFGHALRCGEIAQRLSKSENAIRMMLSRSLKRLRDLHALYEERK
jgi:RNA polymerase sigma-70 factor, ECF subfamily